MDLPSGDQPNAFSTLRGTRARLLPPPAEPTTAPDWASRIVTGPEQVRHEGEPAPAAIRVPVGFVTKEKSLIRAISCGLLPGAIRWMSPSRRKRSAFGCNHTIW